MGGNERCLLVDLEDNLKGYPNESKAFNYFDWTEGNQTMQQTLNFIFPASTGLSSFRDAGYRDTSMAIAELIDNSIQAGAKTIRVITIDEVQQSRASKQVVVNKIAVFDDGEGMSKEVLELSLGFAQGTRLNERKGIGRFGVGLPLASISQCKRVTVYSWQKGKKSLMTYLDIDEVIDCLLYTSPSPRDRG